MEYTVEWETIYHRASNKGLGLPEIEKPYNIIPHVIWKKAN